MGDDTAFARLEELDGLVAQKPLALTDSGRAVLDGRADRVELLGFDRWLGGLHLRAGDALWRWDGERGGLVEP
jgi:hypothetical protein